MTQEQRLDFLIRYLLDESKDYANVGIPDDPAGKRHLLRSLMNVRPPIAVGEDFLNVQDAYLQERLMERGITDIANLTPVRLRESHQTEQSGNQENSQVYLWQGDVTTLAVDAIVNAANSQMLGCFAPCHLCIDNAIHTFAGVQLRLECAKIMENQGKPEPAGQAKITRAYNLPCNTVLHTVGPIIRNAVTQEDRESLADCYRSCLDLAAAHGLRSVAFCCISTGEFHFPNVLAARIATATVRQWQQQHPYRLDVIFNVFKDVDHDIYQQLLR